MLILNNGAAELLGDSLVIGRPLQTPGNVWWVRSVGGVDGASPAGKDREKPLATLAQAQTNATDGDIVVLMNTHTETLTGALTISKSLTIVGGGSNSGVPGVSLLINAAASGLLTLNASGIELRNIYFPASVQSNTGGGVAKVGVSQPNCKIIGCRFECSALDQLPAITPSSPATGLRLESNVFISTATTVATRPAGGYVSSGNNSDLVLIGNVFSDGTVGWTGGYAFTTGAGVITRLRGENNSLLLGAAMNISPTSTGYLEGTITTGGGSIQW
jgi:hypothetical protein